MNHGNTKDMVAILCTVMQAKVKMAVLFNIQSVRGKTGCESPARAATFAWTKLHAQIMSWVSGVYECCLCTKILPEATSTIVHKFTPLRTGCC